MIYQDLNAVGQDCELDQYSLIDIINDIEKVDNNKLLTNKIL